jgi:hypothetical protein
MLDGVLPAFARGHDAASYVGAHNAQKTVHFPVPMTEMNTNRMQVFE